MRRWGLVVTLIGALSTAGVAAAYEGGDGQRGEMPAAVKAIKDKYRGLKEQLHNECKQKMQTLEQEEHDELQAVMKTEHDKHMQEMEDKYQQHMQDMNKRWDEHRQEMQKKREEHQQ